MADEIESVKLKDGSLIASHIITPTAIKWRRLTSGANRSAHVLSALIDLHARVHNPESVPSHESINILKSYGLWDLSADEGALLRNAVSLDPITKVHVWRNPRWTEHGN